MDDILNHSSDFARLIKFTLFKRHSSYLKLLDAHIKVFYAYLRAITFFNVLSRRNEETSLMVELKNSGINLD